MKAKTILAALLSLTLLVGSLAACSGGDTSSEAAETASSTQTESDSGTGEATQADGEFGMKDPASYTGSFSMWSHTAAQPTFMIEHYNELYPNVTVNFEVIPSNEHEQKVQTAVASGVDVPDIFTTKTDFIKSIVASDKFYDDLLSAPYNASHLAGNIEDYVVDVGTDESGAMRALSWQCPVGAIYYRRSLAKEYFGTDDPAEISKLFPSMDSFVEVGRELKEKSGGAVKLFGDYRNLRGIFNSNLEKPFVVDGTINIDPMLVKYFETAKVLYDENLDAKTDTDTNPNFPGLMANGEVFCLISATWALNNNIMNNYPETEGDWALASPPVPFTQGGTWMGIYTGSENKELAYTFLNYVFTDEDFIFQYATELGDYVSHKEVQKRIGAMTPEETADLPLFKFVGNQNVYEFFNGQLANGVRSDLFSEYDFTITNAGLLYSVMDQYVTGQKTLEEALGQYCDDIIEAYPDVKRPEGY